MVCFHEPIFDRIVTLGKTPRPVIAMQSIPRRGTIVLFVDCCLYIMGYEPNKPQSSLFFGSLRWAVLLAAFLTIVAQAQETAASPAAGFEVASIRPMEWSMDCHTALPSGGTHFGIACRSLLELIAIAWHIKGDDIQGGDRSALATLYDVRATLPENKTWSDFDTIRPMLRQLLIERFHVSVHSGSRKASGYGLLVARGGAKLKPSSQTIDQMGQKTGEQPVNWISFSHVQARGEKMSQIATLFSLVLRQPVVDHTGLPGSYNIDLNFAPLSSTDSSQPSFFSAVEDELGLKLHPEEVTVPTLVIDHVDSSPTPN